MRDFAMQRIRQNGYVLIGIGIVIGFLIARANLSMDSPVEAAGGKPEVRAYRFEGTAEEIRDKVDALTHDQ